MTQETIETFGIGFAPHGAYIVFATSILVGKKINPEEMLKRIWFCLLKKKMENLLDRFPIEIMVFLFVTNKEK